MRSAPGTEPAVGAHGGQPGRPLLAGGSPELDEQAGAVAVEREGGRAQWEVDLVAGLAGLLTIGLGIFPTVLFDLVRDAAASFPGLV